MCEYYAGVITGDVVDSTELTESQRRATLEAIERCLVKFSGTASGDIYRGDAFQLYTTAPAQLMLMALMLRLSLIEQGADARLSLAVAKTDKLDLPVRMANNSPAFVLSGRQLDMMKHRRLAFSAEEETLKQDVALVSAFLDDLLSQLTTKMAQALLLWLDNRELQHAVLAEHLGTSRSAFTRIINRANYGRVEETLKWYESRIKRYTGE